MTEARLKQGTWLAVCDGRKALLVENKGNHEFPNLAPIAEPAGPRLSAQAGLTGLYQR